MSRTDSILPLFVDSADVVTFRLRFVASSVVVEDLSGPCERLLGLDVAVLRSDPVRLLDLLPIEDRKALIRVMRRAAIDRRLRAIRCRFRSCAPDGTIRSHLLLHASPVNTNRGRIFHGVILDWTREAAEELSRVRLEERLEHVQRRESLGLLASGIAHDFNNILSAIRGNAELLQPVVPTDSQPRVSRLLQAVDRAAGLVRQILAYSGRGTVASKPLDLAVEIEQLAGLVRHGQPIDVAFDLQLARNLPRVVMDPAQFQQVATNLLVNAAESYQGRGGTVTVTLGQEGNEVVLRVSDRGCGIDPAVAPHIFEPYFTTKTQGHGLGLAAVQGIISAARGTLFCTSQPGQGTCFTVRLPAQRSSTNYVTPLPEAASANETVLVADDDELVREALVAMLTELGYSCLAAEGGRACRRILSEQRRSLCALVLDCRMPDVDGLDILNELRHSGDRIPVVLVSGMISVDHLGDRLRDRRTRFLAKPFTKLQLAATMDVMFGSSRMHPAPDLGTGETPRLVNEVIRSRERRDR